MRAAFQRRRATFTLPRSSFIAKAILRAGGLFFSYGCRQRLIRGRRTMNLSWIVFVVIAILLLCAFAGRGKTATIGACNWAGR